MRVVLVGRGALTASVAHRITSVVAADVVQLVLRTVRMKTEASVAQKARSAAAITVVSKDYAVAVAVVPLGRYARIQPEFYAALQTGQSSTISAACLRKPVRGVQCVAVKMKLAVA